MSKTKKPIPKINQVLAMLVNSKGTQVSVANELGISSQSLGYYMRGRKIPIEVIEKWEQKFQQNLWQLAKTDFETNIETIVSRETNKSTPSESTVEDESDLREALIQSISSINKLLDHNKKLLDQHDRFIDGKSKEVESLERVNVWALGQIDKLTSKLGVPKEAQ